MISRRHWSASVLRSTSTSVETARWAMTAQAMTVFPEPGGATRSPNSCGSQHRLHCFLLLRPEIEGRREVQRISGDSLIVDLDLAAGSLDESRRGVA